MDPGLVEGGADVRQLLTGGGSILVFCGNGIPPVRAEVVIGQTLGLDQSVSDVDTEPVDAPLHPEAQEGAEVLVDVLVGPVEVGLLGGEQVEVVPTAVPAAAGERLNRLPGGAPEQRAPVVRGAVVAVAEDVAVALGGARACGQGGAEPFVLVGGVVGHQVDDHADAGFVEIGDEGVEVFQGSVLEGQIEVVGDVVAGVDLGRGVERRKPHGIDTERGQVVDVPADALDVADPVAVGVGEGAGIDLVDDGVAPPGIGVCARREALGAVVGRGHGRVLVGPQRCGEVREKEEGEEQRRAEKDAPMSRRES